MATMRALNTSTLDQAAIDWAGQWFQATRYSANDAKLPIAGRGWVINCFFNATFKDEFEHLLPRFKRQLGPDALAAFDKAAAEKFTPRDDTVLEKMLATKLAINPAGEHIAGKVGTTQVGSRVVGMHAVEIETFDSLRNRRRLGLDKSHRITTVKVVPKKVPIMAGEIDEAGFTKIADFVRDQGGAFNMNVAASTIILGLDALLNDLDGGTSNASLKGFTGAQPADPDAAPTGTLLFSCACTDPAFPTAVDQADGTVDATASAITDDSSADATNTLGYIRIAATNDGITSIDDKIDGEAGTSGADFNFNTLAIVSGATVSITSWVVTMDQGTTAT